MYLREDADKENWLLYGKCEPVIILSAVGHPTNVSKFQSLAAKASMIAKILSKNVNINASHRFRRAIMNDTDKNTL